MAHSDNTLAWRAVKAHAYGALVIGVFLGILPFLLVRVFGEYPLALSPRLHTLAPWIGLLLIGAGGGLSYACMLVFVIRGDGTAFPEDPPRRLIALGPYRYVRNPMYIGNLMLASGIGMALVSGTYLLYVVALAFATHFYVSRVEEPGLVLRYGEGYGQYLRDTPRWVPRIPVSSKVDRG